MNLTSRYFERSVVIANPRDAHTLEMGLQNLITETNRNGTVPEPVGVRTEKRSARRLVAR